MENKFIWALKTLWHGKRFFWARYHYLFKTPPFRLKKAPQKRWIYTEDKVVIPTAPGQTEKSAATQKNKIPQQSWQAFLYPAGLKIWFVLFSFLPALTIALSFESHIYKLLIMVAYGSFVAFGYLLLYHVFNRPVLSGLWLKWPKSYASLIDDFFFKTYISSTLPHGVRQRRQVAMGLAMREFFPISRFFTHWLTPLWLSYLALIVLFCVAYSHFVLFGIDAKLALHPKQLLLPLIAWWLLSLLFMYRQKKYMASGAWDFFSIEVNKYPASAKDYIKGIYSTYKKPEVSFVGLLAIIQTAAFGIYLALLGFYMTAWSAESKPQQAESNYFHINIQKQKH